VLWGVVFGGIQAASPLGFWWLDPATVYPPVADPDRRGLHRLPSSGRPAVLAVDSAVAGVFVVLAAIGVTGPAWLLVVGLTGHGLKDLWQRAPPLCGQNSVWPPFCLVVDWVVALFTAIYPAQTRATMPPQRLNQRLKG
jgi:hypothetical protein